MYKTNFRHKFNLYCYKIVLTLVFILGYFGALHAQQTPNYGKLNLPGYDERWLHYGFLIGFHQSNFKLNYNEAFTTPKFDSLNSVITPVTGGFKIGFIIDVGLYPYLSLRASPTVGFYENRLNYRYSDGTSLVENKDATLVELPILLKYKSVRRKNNRMYLLAGFSPVIEAAGSKDEDDIKERLETRDFNVNLELGVGTDLFFKYFKFAIELRYSRGLRNLLSSDPNRFNAPLDKLIVHNIGFFITFEGGPS